MHPKLQNGRHLPSGHTKIQKFRRFQVSAYTKFSSSSHAKQFWCQALSLLTNTAPTVLSRSVPVWFQFGTAMVFPVCYRHLDWGFLRCLNKKFVISFKSVFTILNLVQVLLIESIIRSLIKSSGSLIIAFDCCD